MGRRRTYRSYKFTDKHHSKGGIRSSIAAAISLICTVIDIHGAYITKGEAGNYLALFGVIAIAACIYGAYEGNQSFKEEECYYLFSRLGTTISMILLVFWIAVFGMGFLL